MDLSRWTKGMKVAIPTVIIYLVFATTFLIVITEINNYIKLYTK